jgi:metacaspase-1
VAVKKALLVGINAYPGAPLRGCVNDVQQMRALLTQYYGFAGDDIKVLLDKDADKAGIAAGLGWLADGGGDADAVRVFHFSGHGTQQADQNGDEADGRDECLVPYDYQSAGFMTDDALKLLYDRFPRTGNLTLVMDSCHSGSVNRGPEDIAYRFLPVSRAEVERMNAAATKFRSDQKAYIIQELSQMQARGATDEALAAQVETLMTKFEKRRYGDIRTREGNVLLAGCQPDQQAADAHIGGDYHGAFTYYLSQAIQQSAGQATYQQLVQGTVDGLGAGQYGQVPQLECVEGRSEVAAFRPFP